MDGVEDTKSNDKFAGVADKLNAPKKLSQFEKARQEAEQKRQREAAEAAEALREFEDSFAADDDEKRRSSFGRPPAGPGGRVHQKADYEDESEDDLAGIVARGQGGYRQAARDSAHSSRWSRDGPPRGQSARDLSDPSAPPSLKRKRELEEMAARRKGDRSPEDDPAVRRPTMLLQSLPRSTTDEDIRKILPNSLKVEDIKFLSQSADHSLAALVITHTSTPVSEINAIVSSLQNHYLGFGHYLNITRHVSTTSAAPVLDPSLSLHSKNPFGATALQSADPLSFDSRSSLSRAPPPDSFNLSSGSRPGVRPNNLLQVTVTPPSDIKLLKLIHSTAEKLVLYGSTFEAVLMSRPSVQHDEKWAWLFDSSSKAGVYYRWLVWRWASSNSPNVKRDLGALGEEKIFSSGPLWMPPEQQPKYQDVVEIEDLTVHADYVSSSEDEGEEDHGTKNAAGGKMLTLEEAGGDNTFDGSAKYLNPYRRAKLVWLLKRLPDNMAVLRAGDIARVTNFVVANAGNGAEEVVDLLLCNVEKPFYYIVKYEDDKDDEEDGKTDMSGGQLIGLYVISDVLLASATSGVRDAWKYRALFEAALKDRKIFEHLGRLERENGWGKMKGEQWKRKISVILELWYSANVFTSDSQKLLKQRFLEPPLSKEEQDQKEAEDRKEREDRERERWRTAGQDSTTNDVEGSATTAGGDKAAEAMKKIAAMKARLAAGKSADGDMEMQDRSMTPQGETTAAPGRRVRPTAADLIDAPAEPEPAPPKPAGFGGFSLSLGQAQSTQSNPAAPSGGMSFSMSAAPKSASKASKGGNMFADSDEE
ncbi:hypothetical protein BDZ85DRAFT_229632 [Elsinoe ampelina]|uniref:CID domain-containing protein n=1 Tax=Elsinoe ampelina TaxID=302913 RepID=A0A6A6GLA6_9PEZI|nr:hypothetical protein BDZ85DRAFT_229632 [Elsinoe ampelina]